jgi:hypothetical protein
MLTMSPTETPVRDVRAFAAFATPDGVNQYFRRRTEGYTTRLGRTHTIRVADVGAGHRNFDAADEMKRDGSQLKSASEPASAVLEFRHRHMRRACQVNDRVVFKGGWLCE